jgi:hypothetical protein
VLFDLTSSYFEGVTCPLAKIGYSRDGKRGTLQVNYGLILLQKSRTRSAKGRCERRCGPFLPPAPVEAAAATL